MKKYILIVLVAFLGMHGAIAQDWQTDFTKAKHMANEKNVPIVLVFQGSDWCAPCIKLDRDVWSTDEFKSYAKDHYVMLQADFPRRKSNALSQEQTDKNKALAEKYNRNGVFPFVVVMDQTGKVLGETSYKKLPPKEYIKELDAFAK
ncbi:thioredoxin family protein [Maribacter sp. X9]|uniref:thioredoxin family protein n=1 Tax=Maribacter sp. X9 TaxID=3402159 RepID=UPI003AF3A9F1